MVPTALVLSAGGMFAAWEAGVWKVLRDHIEPDMIVGASAGAWSAWSIAGGATAEDLYCEWLDARLARIMRTGELHAMARELFERFQPRIAVGITIVEVPRLRVRVVRGAEIGWRHLAATASIPMVFRPVAIDGKLYVDGGFRGALPLFAAEEMGAARAIALNVLTSWHFRVLRALLWRRRASAHLAVTCIEPSEPLGSLRDAVVWSADNVRRWIALGERDGMRAVGSISR
jgi:NTE family protein